MEGIQQEIAKELQKYFGIKAEIADDFSMLIFEYADCDFDKLLEAIRIAEKNPRSSSVVDLTQNNSVNGKNTFNVSKGDGDDVVAEFFGHFGLPSIYLRKSGNSNAYFKIKRNRSGNDFNFTVKYSEKNKEEQVKRDFDSKEEFERKYKIGDEEYKVKTNHCKSSDDSSENVYDFGDDDFLSALKEISSMLGIDLGLNIPLNADNSKLLKDTLYQLKSVIDNGVLEIGQNSEQFYECLTKNIKKLEFYEGIVTLFKNNGIDLEEKFTSSFQDIVLNRMLGTLTETFGQSGDIDFSDLIKVITDVLYHTDEIKNGEISSPDILENLNVLGDGNSESGVNSSIGYQHIRLVSDTPSKATYNFFKTADGLTMTRSFQNGKNKGDFNLFNLTHGQLKLDARHGADKTDMHCSFSNDGYVYYTLSEIKTKPFESGSQENVPAANERQ